MMYAKDILCSTDKWWLGSYREYGIRMIREDCSMGRLPCSLLFDNLIMHMEFLGDEDSSWKKRTESSVSVARLGFYST